jgi:glycosyltransferase involved in cell wall biosynthesis
MVALTIGMPTYNDFDGVYFTLAALRNYQDLDDTELVVVDNYGCERTKAFVENWVKGRYVLATDAVGTAAAKNRLFAEARGDAVLCCDSHVLFAPGVIARLKAYHRDHPGTRDLLQGPILADDLQTVRTHMDPVWRDQIWGIWATDPRGEDPESEPFDIPMQGMGVFSCRREAWPGFHPALRGFGGEEGYIHEKVRQAGGRCLCLPWLRWVHRFARPDGVPYPALLKDKVRNYIIGFTEVGLDLAPVRRHFSPKLSDEAFDALMREALLGRGKANPANVASPNPATSTFVSASPVATVEDCGRATSGRRAIVVFVEDNRHLIQQMLALRLSWLYSESLDTDLVVMGPEGVLDRLPDDLVKITQRPAADDPVWMNHRYINGVACLNGAGSDRLEAYTHLLRTDADTFITPAWNRFRPTAFTFGNSTYANNDVPQRLQAIAAELGLNHRGLTNVHTTWYGPTAVVRRVAAFAEMLTKHMLSHHFASDPGQWPGWYRGVVTRYAGEIAVNHCAPDAQRSDLLDASSASTASIDRYPHIHCWTTDQMFSKHAFMAGRYVNENVHELDVSIIKNYSLALSVLSLREEACPSALSGASLLAQG